MGRARKAVEVNGEIYTTEDIISRGYSRSNAWRKVKLYQEGKISSKELLEYRQECCVIIDGVKHTPEDIARISGVKLPSAYDRIRKHKKGKFTDAQLVSRIGEASPVKKKSPKNNFQREKISAKVGEDSFTVEDIVQITKVSKSYAIDRIHRHNAGKITDGELLKEKYLNYTFIGEVKYTPADIVRIAGIRPNSAYQRVKKHKDGKFTDEQLLAKHGEVKRCSPTKKKPLKAPKHQVGDELLTVAEMMWISGKPKSTMTNHLNKYKKGTITKNQLLGYEEIPRKISKTQQREEAERKRVNRILNSIPSGGSWERENLGL